MLSVREFQLEEENPEKQRLYEACLKGSREEISKLFQNGKDTSTYFQDGLLPTHVVALAGRRDAEAVLEFMLQNGFDVNAQTKNTGDTLLHLVVEHVNIKDSFPLVLKILEYDPDLNIRNRKLRTPYDIALARGNFELSETLDGHLTATEAREFYLKKIGALYGVRLLEAVIDSKEKDIEDYIRLGADPNFINEHKNAAIHYAVTHCTLPPVRTLTLLISAGADVNSRDAEGDTALNLVIKSAKLRDTGDMYTCAELLVQHGALSTFKDLDGNDALALAQKRNYTDIIRLLGSSRGQHLQVHLVNAIRFEGIEQVQFALQAYNPDPSTADQDGVYPLHHAVMREVIDEDERQEIIGELITAGADVNVKTADSQCSALHLAALNNQPRTAKQLLDTHKCNYNDTDEENKTAYEYAQELGHQDVMDVIDNHRAAIRDKMKKGAKKASICNIL